MSEDINKVQNLVFQGGSVKGICYVGAISALKKCFELADLEFDDRIRNVAGTSAGAITALLLALDYSTEEFIHHLVSTDFKQFMDQTSSRVNRDAVMDFNSKNIPTRTMTIAGALMDINDKLGLFPGLGVLDWLESLVKAKTEIEHCTFLELHEMVLKGSKKFKELTVVGFNLTKDQTHVFNHVNTPNTIISDAVRISMSIPIVFLPHKNYVKKVEADGKISRIVANEDLWVDGGITYNYPIRVFDQPNFNEGTLGFYLVSPDDKHLFETHCLEDKNREIKNGWDYVKCLFESVVSSQQAVAHLRSDDPKRTIYIYHGEVNSLNFALSDVEKQGLVDCGWAAVRDRFGWVDLKCDVLIGKDFGKNEEIRPITADQQCIIS